MHSRFNFSNNSFYDNSGCDLQDALRRKDFDALNLVLSGSKAKLIYAKCCKFPCKKGIFTFHEHFQGEHAFLISIPLTKFKIFSIYNFFRKEKTDSVSFQCTNIQHIFEKLTLFGQIILPPI